MSTVEVAPLSIDQAAARYNVSTKTLRRAVEAGRLPRQYQTGPHGPQLVFDRASLEAWQSGRQSVVEAAPGPLDKSVSTVQPPSADLVGAIVVIGHRLETIEGQTAEIAGLRRSLELLAGQVALMKAPAPRATWARALYRLLLSF